jgi:acetoin utilization deacetylase AcuC-like enzyme
MQKLIYIKKMKIKFVYSEKYVMDWWNHVFPADKYRYIYEKLIKEGVCKEDDFVKAKPPTEDQLTLVHSKQYLQTLKQYTKHPELAIPIFEIPITQQILERFILVAGGSIIAGRLALENGASANIAGGFHHAFSDHGEGFCLINDIAVLIRVLQKEGRVKKAAVIDCDLHQGNGTAHIFQKDKDVFTFSIHQEHLYPFKQKSDWDIGLDDFVGDDEYLSILSDAIPKVLQKDRFDLVVYLAGADPYEGDLLGNLKLTKMGLIKRDRIVFEETKKRGIPVAVVLGGGYAKDKMDVVDIHFNTLKTLKEVFQG